MLRINERLLFADSSISSTVMTAQSAQSAQPTVMVSRNSIEQEGQFRKIYAGLVNGIAIPSDGVQHARLTCQTEIIRIKNPTSKSTNEKEWIEVKTKSKKERFVKQDQFGKTK